MYQKLEETKQPTTLVGKYIKVFLVVALYWCISILTVFVNKHLLSSDSVKLEAPLFVTWFQCVVSAIICFVMSRLAKQYPNVINFPEGNPLDIDTFRKILPLSILFTLMVGTNNLCLKYVGVAFYYVGRSLTTVFNVVLTYALLKQKTSFASIICCAGIVAGFMLGVDQESLTESFSWRGTVFGVLGSLALAMYSIHTKKALQHVNQEVWLLSYYNNLYSSFLFLPLIILNGELEAIITYEKIFEFWFVLTMLIGGLCGFAIGFVTALQIKVTSPLTHNISGTAKACAQTVIACQWYNETKSLLWWTSNIVVLVASAAYTRVKQLEMQRQHNRSNSLAQKA
ncbi:putative GDP-fucose transporter [Lucilia cuprina]|uniref:Putative GDP-fucose transporter n=1 Tax=Lucilia cuprina TaxID=7375 RepID=A0A0L0CRU3_LUCCU|nr:GDP-fucose transporter 1 [Lucilia cuprina]KNC34936.1 putative GDP-fucose transporter [Lucilia cuprina]